MPNRKSKPAPRLRANRSGFPARFAEASDEAICQELDRYPTITAWTEANLSVHKKKGEVPAPNLHMPLQNYLRNHRPSIRLRLEAEAAALAEAWPQNWPALPFVPTTAYRTMVRHHFTRALNARFPDLSIGGWMAILWPAALEILRARPEILALPPTVGALAIMGILAMPTNARSGGCLIYKALLREVRGRIRELRIEASRGRS